MARISIKAGRWTGLVAVTALLATLAGPVAAQEHRSARHLPLPVLMSVVATWIADNTDLPAPEAMPGLARMSQARMAEMRYGGAAGAEGAGEEVEALYDVERRVIYVGQDWTGASPEEVSVLVHEMVHHMQAAADRRFACPAEQERLAYQAQQRWLNEWGSDLERAFGIDPLTLLVRTSCTM